jgi:Do/DeqQ family serine protease
MVSLILVSLNQFSCSQNEKPVFGEAKESPLKNKSDSAKAWEIQNSFRDIYELYKDKVVSITTEQTVRMRPNPLFDDPFFREFFGGPTPQSRIQKRMGLGTGFILSEDGYICTNYHVIEKVDKITVELEGKSYKAKIIGYDDRNDIALLKIEPDHKLKPVFLGNSDEVRVGDWAIAIGNQFGLKNTFTVGVISATERKDVDYMGSAQSMIQTDASINPGNSGGPLININGEVIGINRMIYSNSGGYMGIGFAIPINTAKSILAHLKEYKKIKRGYVGVQVGMLSEEGARRLGLESNAGAYIGAIMEGSPAEKGGLKIGDVVLEIDGKKIKNYTELVTIVGNTPTGKTIKFMVWRNKTRLNIFITVAERP